MAHDIDWLPPFENEGEEPAVDPVFAQECENAIRHYLEIDLDMRIVLRRISSNARFGLVYRADFETSYDGEDSVHRLMFWKLPDGELAKFIGYEIPAPPLN